MGLDATKPVFGVSDKAGLKPVSSATETYSRIFLLEASFNMLLSKKRITKALINLHILKTVFSHQGPFESNKDVDYPEI